MTPNNITVDLGAIRDNLGQIKRWVGPGTGVIAVIKSDAYGHGMIPVAQALEHEIPAYFAVFELQEALALRNAGCSIPILILMGISRDEVPVVIDHGFTVSLFQEDIAAELSRVALKRRKTVPVHVKVDTGMTRLGVPWSHVPVFLKKVGMLKGLRLEGIFSHLAVADEPDNSFTDEQVRRFERVVEEAKKNDVCTRAVHLSNSAAILRGIGLKFRLVRPGIALYGSVPAVGLGSDLHLRPAMTFSSRVIRVETVGPQTPISYGCTHITQRAATIATIPVGYDDGFNRLLTNQGEVLIHGKRAPVVGRVCMNLTMIDVTSIKGVTVGDEVVLLGSQGQERITAEELARKTGTISYEIYCTLGKSNPRSYQDRGLPHADS
jgi:alanine racemase